jgi:hypothetical protein
VSSSSSSTGECWCDDRDLTVVNVCRYDNVAEEAASSAPAVPEEEIMEASTSGAADGSLGDSPLGDLLSWRTPQPDIGACEQTQDLLQLLKQLEALNRHALVI